MNNDRLIKFRSLADESDFKRAKDIIETGSFWCSKLWNLNDPMEGVYRIERQNKSFINNVFNEKNKYFICSFSHLEALNSPLLWGYYANGFKGIAIEIKYSENDFIEPINYVEDIRKIDYNHYSFDPIKIITTKLDCWEHEFEYRYLTQSDSKEGGEPHVVGQITTVYFGTPYRGVTNNKSITKNSKTLRKYNCLKEELKLICKEKGIKTKDFKLNLIK